MPDHRAAERKAGDRHRGVEARRREPDRDGGRGEGGRRGFKALLPAGASTSELQPGQVDGYPHNCWSDLQNSVLTAVILVFIVILYFLGIRSSLLIGFAIPTSFLMGILALSLAGLTVNIVVLFSLILAVGMLVDDAIIVTEYAERRMTEGMPAKRRSRKPREAHVRPGRCRDATRIAAFSPLLFWPGIVGEFMGYLPLTLIARCRHRSSTRCSSRRRSARFSARRRSRTAQAGRPLHAVVKRAVRHPFIACLVLTIADGRDVVAYGKYNNGVEFFPDVEPEYGLVYVHARGNLSLEEQDAAVRRREPDLGWPGIDQRLHACRQRRRRRVARAVRPTRT
jgi:multidrug efflux pump